MSDQEQQQQAEQAEQAEEEQGERMVKRMRRSGAPKLLSEVLRGPFDIRASLADAEFRFESKINAAGVIGLLGLQQTFVETQRRYAAKTRNDELLTVSRNLATDLLKVRASMEDFQMALDKAEGAAEAASDSESEGAGAAEEAPEEPTSDEEEEEDSDSDSDGSEEDGEAVEEEEEEPADDKDEADEDTDESEDDTEKRIVYDGPKTAV